MDAAAISSSSDNGNERTSSPYESTANGIQSRASFHICHNGSQRLSRRLSGDTNDATAEEVGSDRNTIVPSDISTTPRRQSSSSALESIMLMEHHLNVHPTDNTAGETIALTSFNKELRTAHSGESQPLKGTDTTRDEDPIDGATEETNGTNETMWRIWWLEILSSFLALGCIAAIVIILSLHDGKPLPDWPALISVNSLAAIFTAVFKASLIMPIAEGLGQLKWNWFHQPRNLADIVLFDDASRGPWGSLLLIMKHLPRPQKAYLAGLGSLVTIAALAIDPISQAMIEHRGCHINRNPGASEAAEIPRTNNYTANKANYPDQLEWVIDPIMEAALNKGLMDPEETEAQLKFQCTTGNCTFVQGNNGYFFSSLAMCHSCQDITNQVVEDQEKNNRSDSDNRTWHLSVPKDHSGPIPGPHVYGDAFKPKLSVTATAPNILDDDGESPFLSFDALMITLPECESSSVCNFNSRVPPTPVAARCRLQPCVKRYRGQVVNGVYSETEDEEPGQLLKSRSTNGYDEQIAFALVTNSSLIDGEERQCAATADWAPNSVRVDSTYGLLYGLGLVPNYDKVAWKSYPQECVWAVGYTAGIAISAALKDLLAQNITSTAGTSVLQVTGPIWLKSAFADGSGDISTVDKMIRGLANSMTAAMRNNPGDSYQDWLEPNESQRNLRKASGTTSNMQTCVYVHWGWIAYPSSLPVLQWIFSALVLASRRPSVASGGKERIRTAWKSSPLALLFHGLDEDLRKKSGSLCTIRDMDKLAGKVNVQLAPVDGSKDKGWRFYES